MEQQWEEQQRNREAESAKVRAVAWGDQSVPKNVDDEMRQTILGDVHHPAPIIVPPAASPWPLVLAAAIAAGALGYFANKPAVTPEPVVAPAKQPYEDESISIRLGRIEDIVGANE